MRNGSLILVGMPAKQVIGRRIFSLTSVIIMLALCRLGDGNERYDAWQARHPFTQTAWGTHRYAGGEEVDLDYFRGSGLNTFWDGVRSGSGASKHPYSQGLPTLLMASLGSKRVWPDLPTFLADFELAQTAHENIIGVILGDEVSGAGPKAHMRAVRDWIVDNKDPKISSMITISSIAAVSEDHWNELHATIQPDVYLFQHYPSFRVHETELAGYYSRLERYSNWTREKDVAFWLYPRAYSSVKLGVFTESELRLQRFTSLAYGVRGFSDFMWPCTPPSVPGAGYWDGSGKPTPTYELLAPINREIANVAKSLIRLTPVGAYHVDSTGDKDHVVRHWMDRDTNLPGWMRRTWKLANVSGPLNRNHLLVGFFRDAAGQEYFLVVNKDHAEDRTSEELATEVVLTFHPSVKAIQRLSRTDGVVERIPVEWNHIFTLPGSTGDLFKFDTGASFAGVEPVVLPALRGVQPGDGDVVLPRLAENRFIMNFDRDASAVCAEIRRLDENGQTVGPDLAESFSRVMADDNRTVIYEEIGAELTNETDYRVTAHWADASPFLIRTLRGDVNGDGEVTDKDMAMVEQAMKSPPVEAFRLDLDANGKVDEADLQVIDRLLHPAERFRWSDSFEEHPIGPLTGRGSWLGVESLPSSVVGKAVIKGPALVTDEQGKLHGQRKLEGRPYPDYRGNELLLSDLQGGAGDSGVLRCGFTARLGTAGVQRVSFHISNSRDTDGVMGTIHSQIVTDVARVSTSRGVELLDATDGVFRPVKAMQGPGGKGLAVELLADFDAGTITWKCENMDSGKVHGPRTVHYRGRFRGLDSVSFWICGPGAQMDHMWVQNY